MTQQNSDVNRRFRWFLRATDERERRNEKRRKRDVSEGRRKKWI
jgi:hypothetical protein